MIPARLCGLLVCAFAAVLSLRAAAAPEDFLRPRFQGVETNSAVKFADVVDYKGKPRELFVDFYRPAGDTATNRPVVVLIHGGGFRTDGKRTQKYIVHFANEFARRGFVAASIDYRQREGKDMPTAADELPAMKDAAADSLSALQWIRGQGAEYGYDPSKIFLIGGSAGGRVVCALACRENGDTGGLPVDDKFSTTDPPSSVTSEATANYDRSGLVAAAVLWGGPEPEYRCFTVDGGDLPCLFVHGTHDSLVPADGSVVQHDKLARAGVSASLHLLNGYEHSLKVTDAAGEDAKPPAAQWMSDFFVKEWQRREAGAKATPPIPDLAVSSGGKLALSLPVSWSGFRPSLQWKRDGSVIDGATDAEFVIERIAPGDAGLYEVTVSNPPGNWPKDKVASLSISNAPINTVEFENGGPEGKHRHPLSITVPVARVSVK